MTTHPKREYTPEEIAALVAALRNTPNWHRETFGDWKDMSYVGDNSPFKAADMLECLASQLAVQKRDTSEVIIWRNQNGLDVWTIQPNFGESFDVVRLIEYQRDTLLSNQPPSPDQDREVSP
jgi:hypothetical protein